MFAAKNVWRKGMLTQITKQLKQFQIFLAIHLFFIQMLVYAPNKKKDIQQAYIEIMDQHCILLPLRIS